MALEFGRACVVAIALVVLAGCGDAPSEEKASSPNHWLQNAASDGARFALIERQLRGFDSAMWEVGERYRSLHDALQRENYDLALYHWDKIKTAIDNGTERRPARRANAETLFLAHWDDIRAEIASRESARVWDGFDRATAACQSCHQAENVAHINDQALFELRSESRTP